MVKKAGLVVLGLMMLVAPAFAQDTTATDTTTQSGSSSSAAPGSSSSNTAASPFSMGAVVGATTIDGVTYTQIRINPNLDFDNFGIGLDVNLEFDADGNIRDGEWETWQAIVSKIRYLRFGKKGGPFYFKIGNLDNVTIGHGTIMDGFSNSIFYPDMRLMGAQLNIDLGFAGFESFTDNFLDLDILAGRVFFRPLIKSGIPILKNLHVGASYAVDRDIHNIMKSGNDKYDFTDNSTNEQSVAVYGFDIGVPLPSLGILTWTAFFDYMQIKDKGSGWSTGLYGKLLLLFNWKLQYNRFGEKFTSPFFDYYYLSERSTRYSSLDSITDAYNGWQLAIWRTFKINGVDALTLKLEYEDSTEVDPMYRFVAYVDRSLLFNKMEVMFDYTKKNVSSFKDAFTIEDLDSIISMTVGYMIADNVMLSVNYTKTFIMDETTGSLTGQESTTIQTELRF